MSIYKLLSAVEKAPEWDLQDFIHFTIDFLEFTNIGEERQPNIQADIVSTSDSNYHFLQYKDDGHYCVTRPINYSLMLSKKMFISSCEEILPKLSHIRNYNSDLSMRETINKIIYTCQQSVGCTLDALNNENSAKKRNGAIFERLIYNIISACGIVATHETESINLNNSSEFIRFEHDIILQDGDGKNKAIGQIKTSTKDRIDKVFIDNILYKSVASVDIPYFLIVLNDIQRSKRKDGLYSTNSTFLPGHFKAYTIALLPLDGVYYIDMVSTIKSDKYFDDKIFSFDKLLFEDMWEFIER